MVAEFYILVMYIFYVCAIKHPQIVTFMFLKGSAFSNLQFLRLFPFILQSPNLTFYCGRMNQVRTIVQSYYLVVFMHTRTGWDVTL